MKSINKKFIFSFLLASLFLINPVFAVEEMTGESTSGETAIIILSTNTVSEMQTARKVIEKNGGKIRSVFPPGVFIGTIARNISAHLEEMDIIKEISYEKINPDDYRGYESSVQDAIKLWNRKLDKILKPEEEVLKPEEPFRDDVIIPTDLPRTREEKIKKDREYQERWKLKKEKLQGVDVFGTPAVSVSAEFGEAYGAGYYDTSLYMAGDIAVGVFFREGADGAWITENIDNVFITICDALSQFIDDEPNADISFTCIKEVDESGIPNPAPSSERDYVNDLRNIYNTHWAFMIIVTNESGRASANLFGPSTGLYSSNGYISYRTVRHETMHIFGAMDQYCPDACKSPINRWGYLNVVNANSLGNDGNGYFSGAGEGIDDILTGSNGPIGVYSRGQIGWRDSDGDGILEPVDTFPDTVILTKTGANPFTYTGRASDKPLLNNYKSARYGDVTLNTITRVEYRINGGAWSDTEPSDGAFDSGEEEFTFTLPSLSDGRYTIEVRAINSVDNTEVSHAAEEILIEGSSITNVRPFASFSITPKKGSVETNFIFDASVSSDIEDDSSVLQARWDFEDDGVWDTDFSEDKTASYNYYTSGNKTIRLEVIDSGGLTHTAVRQVDVAAANIPPEAFFTTTPENRHGNYETFDVELNAAGSYDGEDALTALRVRWDFEDDGVWDTDYSNTMAITLSYELPIGLPGIVIATPGPTRAVYVSGNYAYVATGTSGLQVIDITDPANPFIMGSSDTPGYADTVYVSGDYAYIGDGYEGLQVIDITDPTAPYIVGSSDTPDYAHGVYVSGNYAYVADGTSGLQLIDISDPANPFVVGSSDSDTPGYARGVYVSGNYAYVIDSPWLHVIDITDPTATYIVGSLRTNGAYGVYVSGNYAYVAAAQSGLQVIDITDPANPYIAGSSDTPEDAFSVYVSGDYAYVATTGLQVIDITDPTTPYIVASRDTPSEAWGVYVLGDYAYVPDISSGLWIIDITYPFKFEVLPVSTHWRAKLEVMDADGNISGATRDMWAVTYNQPPSVDNIEFSSDEAGLLTIRALGGTDPDIDTTWDGLLEYRWDIDNDGVWDTEFTESDSYVFVPASDEYAVVCEVKDRFNATDRVVIGTATDPDISVSPPFKNFGSLRVGSVSPAQIFTISNTGGADLVIKAVYLTDTMPYQFRILNDNCSGQTIAPSATCTLEAVFKPAKAGVWSTLIGIESNDPDTPTLYIELTGTGIKGHKKSSGSRKL